MAWVFGVRKPCLRLLFTKPRFVAGRKRSYRTVRGHSKVGQAPTLQPAEGGWTPIGRLPSLKQMKDKWVSSMPSPRVFFLCAVLALGVAESSQGFNPPTDEKAGFRAEIHVPDRIEIARGPVSATVEIENQTDRDAAAEVALALIDGWKATPVGGMGPDTARGETYTQQIPAKTTLFRCFEIRPATDSYSAHYPIHASIDIRSGSEEVSLHPIAVVETVADSARPAESTPASCVVVPEEPFLLMEHTTTDFEIRTDTGPIRSMGPGWTGMEPETKAHLLRIPAVQRGSRSFPAFAVHPPWIPGPGRARVLWRAKLPMTSPITFGAFLAIRDSQPGEPLSDGVTFRVCANGQVLFERHTDSKSWEEIRVDISSFAGQEMTLALESDVGPKRDSTCDLSYWGQPWIYAGNLPSPTEDHSPESAVVPLLQLLKKVLHEVLSKPLPQPPVRSPISSAGVVVYPFGKSNEPYGLALLPGPHGILDALWAVGTAQESVTFEGFTVRLDDRDPLDFLSGFKVESSTFEGNTFRSVVVKGGREQWVSLAIAPNEGGVELKWDSDLCISHLSVGRFGREATHIYAGVGNVIHRPRTPFSLHADGHQLSARHIGLSFDNGLHLLVACSNPPDRLAVNPDLREYALHSHHPGSFYLVPSATSAFDAVLKYREMLEFPKAPGVDRLAGRFTFDLWGGSYRNTSEALDNAARYGLTDSVAVFHAWQRWGYDYRLPDIYPPNPQLGTLAEFRQMREVCRANGILFAPHDNYIDFYPDAQDFSYDHVCFDSSGNPVKGWMNFGRDAQAYRFRPDSFLPFLERNLRLIKEGFDPDGYFVDVFSSIGAFDYWGRDGSFHSTLETIRNWGESFDRAREMLGSSAVQISESGTDLLLGHLDGAQCNHLCVTEKGTVFSWGVDCEDHEKVPWQDLAMHDVFVLQGAGYPNRYCSGRDIYYHGIHSDDYLSAEVLTGHAPMVSDAFGRATVRKYWLLHDFLKQVAAVPMARVEFAEGDIHKQTVTYSNGAVVWVNRSNERWTLPNGQVLPQYGFWAEGPTTQAGVFELAGRPVELSLSPDAIYADPRGIDCQELVPLGVSLVGVTPVRGQSREFSMTLEWTAVGDLALGCRPFVHFSVPGPYGFDKSIFQARGELPEIQHFSKPRSKQTLTFTVPDTSEKATYTMRAGIWNPEKSECQMLLAKHDQAGTVPLGEFQFDPATDRYEIAKLDTSWEGPIPSIYQLIDFGSFQTSVGVRVVKENERVLVAPLPNGKSAPFRLHCPSFNLSGAPVLRAEQLDGDTVTKEGLTQGDYLKWELDPAVFRYVVSQE